MKVKKTVLTILMVLLCLNLTGCNGIIKSAQDFMSEVQKGSLKDTIAEDNLFAMSEDTKKAQTKAVNMQDKASFWGNSKNFWDKLGPVAAPVSWVCGDMEAKRTADANIALDKYETKKSQDSVFLNARAQAGKTGVNGVFQWSKLGWILGIAIILLIIIIFKILANKKRRAKAEVIAAKKGKPPAPTPQPAVTGDFQAKLVDRNDEKSIKSCHKYCDKFGIDYDTYLAQHNNDPKQLLDFLMSSSAEDFK